MGQTAPKHGRFSGPPASVETKGAKDQLERPQPISSQQLQAYKFFDHLTLTYTPFNTHFISRTKSEPNYPCRFSFTFHYLHRTLRAKICSYFAMAVDTWAANFTAPFEVDKLLEVRMSGMKKMPGLNVNTGIDKKICDGPMKIGKLGLEGDWHDLTFHGGPDKAILGCKSALHRR